MYWWLCLGLWTTQKPIKRHAFQTGEVQRFLANCVPPFPVLLFSLSPPPLSIHVYSFESFLFTSVSPAITVPRFVTFDKRKFFVARVRPANRIPLLRPVQTDQRSSTFSTFETTHVVHASSPRFQYIHSDFANFLIILVQVNSKLLERRRWLEIERGDICVRVGNACVYLRGGVVVVVVVVGVVLMVVLLVVVISQVSVGSVVVHLVTSGIWLSSTCSTTAVTVVVLTGDLVVDKTVVVVVLG